MAEEDSSARRVPASWQDDTSTDGSLNCDATTAKMTLECSDKAVTATVSQPQGKTAAPAAAAPAPALPWMEMVLQGPGQSCCAGNF